MLVPDHPTVTRITMLKGRAIDEMFELETKQSWDERDSAGLEAKEIGEQVTDGLGIYLASG